MFSALFVVGANCVRPRAFTERPYGISFKSCFIAGRHWYPFFLV